VEQILEDPELNAYHGLAREALGRGWVFQMALVWRVSNELMMGCEGLSRKLVVYEELCAEPLTVVAQLFDYLGWPMSEQTVRHVQETSEVSSTEAESGHFSLRKNAAESLSRWRRELDVQIYGDASEAIGDSVLMRFWSETELSFRSVPGQTAFAAADASAGRHSAS
jgi:hypothetical protein